ncbi:MAG: tRNA preQ1(34) S-adenosylmethionine ribosyltransferase-isomerase QueA [Candidatus Buchananbacteria bacterium RBG_13_39_9]|uniref:S-adenosylmethionine:tRNA ribosyltransferase-isomerase n=1 Tax=Candidatus Buchananbacteria bacterium RBG_13_39_9 TaxID=1797531 RepID=A0A1G1XSX6_9BACT|nr:MAG: tRNA preQ1(34) S-adenosylmethionine ribosyltransferase-isomerase QueA [Candidatus Buchananbacteria bacterium RBG_13_39_9]
MKKLYDLESYDFQMPKSLIAQKPASPPDTCRLLVLNRKTKKITDEKFLDLPDYLQKGDVLVFNNSKVIPARLIGRKLTGGKVEILLLRQIKPDTWECLVGNLPIKKQVGTTILFAGTQEHPLLKGQIAARIKDTAQIKFNLSGQKLMDQIFRYGQMPTPPYIKRLAKQNEYQTFFADPKKLGSIAAPTAGLHFTPRMFKLLKQKGVQTEFVTLHVGFGTFQPIKVENIAKHQMHEEYFELDKQTAKRLNQAKKEKRRIIAVGTTSVRVIETCSKPKAKSYELRAKSGATDIYIYPGYKFKFVDSIITNFHLPKSSLLLLTSAFAGTNLLKQTYQYALNKKYRFYSFGDVMLIL